jgi:hypothetical protein
VPGFSCHRLCECTASFKTRGIRFGRFILVSRLVHSLVSAMSDISVLLWTATKVNHCCGHSYCTLLQLQPFQGSSYGRVVARAYPQRNYSPWRQLSPVSLREVKSDVMMFCANPSKERFTDGCIPDSSEAQGTFIHMLWEGRVFARIPSWLLVPYT